MMTQKQITDMQEEDREYDLETEYTRRRREIEILGMPKHTFNAYCMELNIDIVNSYHLERDIKRVQEHRKKILEKTSGCSDEL